VMFYSGVQHKTLVASSTLVYKKSKQSYIWMQEVYKVLYCENNACCYFSVKHIEGIFATAKTKHFSVSWSRMMYWTEWGKNPMIMGAKMNGQDFRPLLQSNLKWPNGLLYDEKSKKLFFADGGTLSIQSISSGRMVFMFF